MQSSFSPKAFKRPRRKSCNTPTIYTNDTEKRIWGKLLRDEPFPKDISYRLINTKRRSQDFQDEQEEGAQVVEEQENELLQQKRPLPHFTVMSDHGEFASRGRNKIKIDRKTSEIRCHSVESQRLPQVQEEKREDDGQPLGRSKLSQFRDHNEFGQRSSRNPETSSPLPPDENQDSRYTPVPEKIIQTEAEETRSDKAKQDKSAIASEIQKIFVDEVDQRKRGKEEQTQIEEIVEQQRQEEETENVKKLRHSLSKLEQENEFLCQFREKELAIVQGVTDEEKSEDKMQPHPYCSQEIINQYHQNQE